MYLEAARDVSTGSTGCGPVTRRPATRRTHFRSEVSPLSALLIHRHTVGPADDGQGAEVAPACHGGR